MKRLSLLILAICVVIVTPACQANTSANSSKLRLSGAIEGTQAAVVAEISGRVIEVGVDEGDEVEAGQVVVELDDASLQVQVKQAQAGVSAAEANLAQVKAGARSEEIAAAEAALAQAEAERDGAFLAYTDTLAILNNPQQLLAQIDAARTGVELAEKNVAIAETELDEAKWWREFYEDDPGRHEKLDKQIAIAQRELEAAQAQLDGAKAQLSLLYAMRREPVALQAQVNNALSAYTMTLANAGVAGAELAELKAGASPEEIALAEARLHQAQAQLKLAQAYLSRARLRAPLEGTVASRSVHVGETIQPGVPLMTIVNLDEVTLVVYVPQVELPRVRLGAPVDVYVDAYPGEVFKGEVVFIAREAQFSSRDTQAREDRANVVFAIKVHLLNADHRLKAGMTADAVIGMD